MKISAFRSPVRRASAGLLAIAACLCEAGPASAIDEVGFMRLQDEMLAKQAAGQYAEQEALARQMLAITPQLYPNLPRRMGLAYHNLCVPIFFQGRYEEAAGWAQKALVEMEKNPYGKDDAGYAGSLNMLGNIRYGQARYAEAETVFQEVLTIRTGLFGPQHSDVAETYNNLANVYVKTAEFAEAEKALVKAVKIFEATEGRDHPALANALHNLATLYSDQDRNLEAEPMYRRALAIREQALDPNHPQIAQSLNNLSTLLTDQGRFAESEVLLRRAAAIYEAVSPGGTHPEAPLCYNNLANVYADQSRDAEAEAMLRMALAGFERIYGPDHVETAVAIDNLSGVEYRLGRYNEAEAHSRRAVAIYERAFGPDHPKVAMALEGLASTLSSQGKIDEAAELDARTLEIRRRTLGPTHPTVAFSLNNIAVRLRDQGKRAEARKYLDEAIAILDATTAERDLAFTCYDVRARLSWDEGNRAAAIEDAHRALALAESLRSFSSGGEIERSATFADYSGAFLRMVGWQIEMGDSNAAFQAAERARARLLLEQMQLQGADLLAGVPLRDAGKLRRKETAAKVRAAAAAEKLRQLAADTSLSSEARRERLIPLEAVLQSARQEVSETYAEIRNVSPAYRMAAAGQGRSVDPAELARWLKSHDALLLEYAVAADETYLIVIDGEGKPEARRLSIDEADAKLLGTPAGRIGAAQWSQVLQGHDGVVAATAEWRGPGSKSPVSANGTTTASVSARLEALWRVLVPEKHRAALLSDAYRHLVVVTDGPLARLPFDTLVTRDGDTEDPRYLLDDGPPILTCASATLLLNLSAKPNPTPTTAAAVLTVGDPTYSESAGVGEAERSRSVYRSWGGVLNPLPYTADECRWVAQAFADHNLESVKLLAADATEQNVRNDVAEKIVVHLACHGLVDERQGNLFGALALTPGTDRTNPDDDGFLTLAETYELKLNGCELAILSACETNLGPQQQGEGVFALSRGFLVSGGRRVIAGNWRIDDEATANLVGHLCEAVAAGTGKNDADFALALQQAKRLVRKQPQWKHPYFWGALVLIGPN